MRWVLAAINLTPTTTQSLMFEIIWHCCAGVPPSAFLSIKASPIPVRVLEKEGGRERGAYCLVAMAA